MYWCHTLFAGVNKAHRIGQRKVDAYPPEVISKVLVAYSVGKFLLLSVHSAQSK